MVYNNKKKKFRILEKKIQRDNLTLKLEDDEHIVDIISNLKQDFQIILYPLISMGVLFVLISSGIFIIDKIKDTYSDNSMIMDLLYYGIILLIIALIFRLDVVMSHYLDIFVFTTKKIIILKDKVFIKSLPYDELYPFGYIKGIKNIGMRAFGEEIIVFSKEVFFKYHGLFTKLYLINSKTTTDTTEKDLPDSIEFKYDVRKILKKTARTKSLKISFRLVLILGTLIIIWWIKRISEGFFTEEESYNFKVPIITSIGFFLVFLITGEAYAKNKNVIQIKSENRIVVTGEGIKYSTIGEDNYIKWEPGFYYSFHESILLPMNEKDDDGTYSYDSIIIQDTKDLKKRIVIGPVIEKKEFNKAIKQSHMNWLRKTFSNLSFESLNAPYLLTDKLTNEIISKINSNIANNPKDTIVTPYELSKAKQKLTKLSIDSVLVNSRSDPSIYSAYVEENEQFHARYKYTLLQFLKKKFLVLSTFTFSLLSIIWMSITDPIKYMIVLIISPILLFFWTLYVIGILNSYFSKYRREILFGEHHLYEKRGVVAYKYNYDEFNKFILKKKRINQQTYNSIILYFKKSVGFRTDVKLFDIPVNSPILQILENFSKADKDLQIRNPTYKV